jgi:hypothetical protein
MPIKMISCVSLPPATTSSVPINDYANANEELAKMDMEAYYHVAGRVFVEGACTPSKSLGILGHVHFVKQIIKKQTMQQLKN